jgi:GGDEF domain-containing protein
MADDPSPRFSVGVRAVADLPIEALLTRVQELARGWAIALIRGGSMERMGSIPMGELSRDAPALCAQVLRALRSDADLDGLTGRAPPSGREQSVGARGLAAATGARDAEAIVEAVEALRAVLWETVLEELRAPPPRLVADLADRLGYVCSRASASAIAALAPEEGSSHEAREPIASQADRTASEPGDGGSALRDVVIVDERAESELAAARAPRAESELSLAQARHSDREPSSRTRVSDAERPLSWDESPPVAAVPSAPVAIAQPGGRPLAWDESPPVHPAEAAEEIEIRDVRAEEGPSAWIGSIGRQLARFQDDGLPFAVLLVELLEIDSLRREEPRAELARLSERVQETLTAELRIAGASSLTCESPGRYWLLALDTDRTDADRLAERLARAVASSAHYRQAPVTVVLGAAICPDDGLQAPMLAAHADVGLYAARSAARAMAGRQAGGLVS